MQSAEEIERLDSYPNNPDLFEYASMLIDAIECENFELFKKLYNDLDLIIFDTNYTPNSPAQAIASAIFLEIVLLGVDHQYSLNDNAIIGVLPQNAVIPYAIAVSPENKYLFDVEKARETLKAIKNFFLLKPLDSSDLQQGQFTFGPIPVFQSHAFEATLGVLQLFSENPEPDLEGNVFVKEAFIPVSRFYDHSRRSFLYDVDQDLVHSFFRDSRFDPYTLVRLQSAFGFGETSLQEWRPEADFHFNPQ